MEASSATALCFSQFHQRSLQNNSLTLSPETSVLEAWTRMQELKVSEMLVARLWDGEIFLVGQISKSLLSALVTDQRNLASQLKIFEVMRSNPITCSVGAGVFEMIQTMQESRTSLLPLVNDEGALQGVVTADNLSLLLKAALKELESLSSLQSFNA